MNTRNFVIVIAAVSAFLFVNPNCFGINYSIDNNLGAPKLPTTGPRDSFAVPAPAINNGNLVVTGNVRGLKYFRGVVPYSDTPDFDASLGSSALDSFLRRSAPINYAEPVGKYQSYYLPSRTVTSINRNSVSGLKWVTIKANKGTGNFVTPSPRKALEDNYGYSRPLSLSPHDIQRLISEDYYKEGYYKRDTEGRYERDNNNELSEAIHNGQNEILTRDLTNTEDKTKQRVVDISQRPPVPEKIELKNAEPQKIINPETYYFAKKNNEQKTSGPFKQKTPDVFEQMRQDMQQQIDDETLKQAKEKAKTSTELPEIKHQNPEDIYKFAAGKIDSATANAMRGVHETFATQATDKFNSYMRTAEDLMKRGKFYRAADAYTLASLYKPSDPLPYVGKSHSLLASGEYMSSAYFLAKAINMFPEYANIKVDLVAMIGDKDKLQSRIADIVTWQKRSNSGELQFLLGYVYYQNGKLKKAKEAVDDAAEKIPGNFAVKTLKEAIDAAAEAENN